MNNTQLQDPFRYFVIGAIVQSGWKQEHFSRTPVIVMIKDPMSKSCIYQRDKKDDPKCQGCKELEL